MKAVFIYIKVKKTIFFMVLFSFVLYLYSSNDSSAQKVLSLEECINTALKQNLSLLNAELNNDISTKEYHRSLAQALPSFSAYAQEYYNSGRTFNNEIDSIVDNKSWSGGSGGISGSMQLFNGFQNLYSIQQNRIGVKASQEEYSIARNNLIGLVIRTFYQIIISNEQLTYFTEQLARTEKVVRRTEILVEEGQRRQSELFRIKAQYEQEKMQLLQAENNNLLAKNNLATLMHYDNYSDIIVEDSTNINPDFFLEGFDRLQSQILNNSPLLKNRYYLQEISEYRLKGSRRAFMPCLSLNASITSSYTSLATNPEDINRNYLINDQLNNNLFSQVYLTLSIPIFSQLQLKYNNNISKIRNLQAINNYESAKLEIQYTSQLLYLTAKAAYQNYLAAQQLVKANELSYLYTEKSYELGTANIIELTTASNDLMSAKISLTEAKTQYIINCKILELNATGEY